jgi:hypothetical protein
MRREEAVIFCCSVQVDVSVRFTLSSGWLDARSLDPLDTTYIELGTMAVLRMAVDVLAVGAMLDRSATELYGLQIGRASGLEPGTIYPILRPVAGRRMGQRPMGGPRAWSYHYSSPGTAKILGGIGLRDRRATAGFRPGPALGPSSLRWVRRLLPGEEGTGWWAAVTSCLAEAPDPGQRRQYVRSWSVPELV